MEQNATRISSYLLIKKIASVILAVSTIAGAAYVGAYQVESIFAKIVVGAFSGSVAFLAIDKLLSAIMNDMIDPKQKSILKWFLMVVLLIMTGSTTAIFGIFISEDIGAPKSTQEKQEIRSIVLSQYDARVNENQKSVDQLKKEIRSLTYAFKKDTAAIIAAMPENHRRLYRKGYHTRYINRSGYATLKENINRIDNRVTNYENAVKGKTDALTAIETGLAQMRVSDPLLTVNSEIKKEEEKAARMGDIVKGMIWVFDAGAVFALFFSFIFIRSSIKSDPTIDIPQIEVDGWVLDRLNNLMKKLLESTDGADKDLQYFTRNFVFLFTSIMGLFGFFAAVVSHILTAPRRISEQNGFAKFDVITNDNSTDFSTGNQRTIVNGFQQAQPTGPKPVENKSTTHESTTVQQALPTRVVRDLSVEKPVEITTHQKRDKSVEKPVEKQRKIQAEKPLKKTVEKDEPKVLKILPDIVEIRSGEKVEILSKAKVQRRKSSNYWNAKHKRKTKAGKARSNAMGDFYASLEKQMNDA